MARSNGRKFVAGVSGWIAIALTVGRCTAIAAESPDRPDFAQVEKAAASYFKSLRDYRPGDLLSQREVQPLIKQLRELGWKSLPQKKILEKVLGDSHYLVARFETPAGRKFMRTIAQYPAAYDRLYRLAELPDGRRIVDDLILGRGGHEMIEYLTTSRGGRNLGRQLARTPRGQDFNKPTGLLFTEELLLAELKAIESRGQDSGFRGQGIDE